MNGTLAIWYEPLVGPGVPEQSPPKLELHFNLWRDLPSRTHFLDVGMRLSDLAGLDRAYLYFPVPLALDQISDLSTVLKFDQTLSAVFNSVVELGPQADDHYQTMSKDAPFVTVHSLDIGRDLTVEPIRISPQKTGSLLTLTSEACRRLRASAHSDPYIRFRIKLRGRSRTLFSHELTAPDKIFVSSFHRLELTEFRLNEQRSYPPIFAKVAREHMFEIERIHYFLIRELGHELVMQHQPFRKVRRLETGLWAPYLQGEASEHLPAVSEKVASRMVIYHWREGEPGKDGKPRKLVEDFVAFASFKAQTPSILFYLVAIILLGALGNGLWTALSPIGLAPAIGLCFALVGALLLVTSPWVATVSSRLVRWIAEVWADLRHRFSQ